jgi:hypothetical protein
MVAAWIAAQTVIVYCGLFYLSYTYSGPFKWPMTAIFTILCGKLTVLQSNCFGARGLITRALVLHVPQGHFCVCCMCE